MTRGDYIYNIFYVKILGTQRDGPHSYFNRIYDKIKALQSLDHLNHPKYSA